MCCPNNQHLCLFPSLSISLPLALSLSLLSFFLGFLFSITLTLPSLLSCSLYNFHLSLSFLSLSLSLSLSFRVRVQAEHREPCLWCYQTGWLGWRLVWHSGQGPQHMLPPTRGPDAYPCRTRQWSRHNHHSAPEASPNKRPHCQWCLPPPAGVCRNPLWVAEVRGRLQVDAPDWVWAGRSAGTCGEAGSIAWEQALCARGHRGPTRPASAHEGQGSQQGRAVNWNLFKLSFKSTCQLYLSPVQ